MFRLYIVLFLATLFYGVLPAQLQDMEGYENGTNFNIPYKNEISGKLFLNTRGYGLSFHRAKKPTSRTANFYEVDMRALRHPKEIKMVGDAFEKKRYVYGKINVVTVLGGNLGIENVLFTKSDSKAVEIRYSYSLGPLLAFIKPYYVRANIIGGTQKNPVTVKFDEDHFSETSGRIVGRAPFSHGLSDLKINPGINAKFNLNFEYAPYSNLIRAIETGISIDYYPKAIKIMYQNPSENVILTVHLGLVFGRKWY
jgi:hypothetical protein